MAETATVFARNDPQGLSHGVSDELLRRDFEERIEVATRRRADQTSEFASGSTVLKTVINPTVGIDFDSDAFDDLNDLAYIPRIRPQATFHALQEWEGYVLEVSTDEFTAKLLDLTVRPSMEEEAIIPLSEISDIDRRRLKRGSIFRWVIGYENRGGTKRRISQIVFRDLPVLTRRDVEEGSKWAEKVVRLLEE